MKIARISADNSLVIKGEIIEDGGTKFTEQGNIHINELIEVDSGIRYIRDWISGSVVNGYNHWYEIEAIANGINVALGKEVTTNGYLMSGSLSWVTDGTHANYVDCGANPKTYVQIDLGSIYDVSEIKVWHFYHDGRMYYDTKTEVSADGINWVSIFDSTGIEEMYYHETIDGKTHLVPPVYAGNVNYIKIANSNMYVNELIEGVKLDPFAPNDISGCVLWADVETIEGNDGDVVNMLPELVNGNDFVSNNFNGNNILNTTGTKSIIFNGWNDMSTIRPLNIFDNQPRTIIALCKPYYSGNIFGYGVDGSGMVVDGLLYGDSKFAIHAYGVGYDNIEVAPQFELNEIQAFSIIYDGVQVKTGVNRNISQPIGMALSTTSTSFRIGKGAYNGFNSFSGEIMEVLIYDRALNDTELNTVIDYLGSKRGLLL